LSTNLDVQWKIIESEINRIHVRALRVLLDHYGPTFEELLQNREEHTIHSKNLQTVLLEVYKSSTSKNPSFLWDLLERRPTNYNLRKKDLVQLPSTKTVRYGLDSEEICHGTHSLILLNLPKMTDSLKTELKVNS